MFNMPFHMQNYIFNRKSSMWLARELKMVGAAPEYIKQEVAIAKHASRRYVALCKKEVHWADDFDYSIF